MRRNHFEIVGEVKAGASVGDASVTLDQFVELSLLKILGAFEHEVLEKMRESGAIFRLDAEADVVVNGNHDERCGGIAREGHFQAVGQFVIGDGNSETGRSRLSGRERCQQERKSDSGSKWQDTTS